MDSGERAPKFLWIKFNIALFTSYAVFDTISLFWPSIIENTWFILFYAVTILINLLIVYGLIKKIIGINYLVILVSLLMTGHLLIFIFVPLGMELAYIGPSRAFYTLFVNFISRIAEDRLISYTLLIFNIAMLLTHIVNVVYFTRHRVSALFRNRPF